MPTRDTILDALLETCDEINGQLPASERLTTDPETVRDEVLIGEGGVLDSLGVLNFLMAFETRLEQDGGWTIALVGDEALAVDRMTLGGLADVVVQRVETGAG